MVEKRPHNKCAKSEKTADYKPKRGKHAPLMNEEAKKDASIHDNGYLDDKQFNSLSQDCERILKILTSIVKTMKDKMVKG